MTSIPPTMAAEMALNKQNVTMSVIKQSADQQKAILQIIEQSVQSAPVSGARGSNVNIGV